MKEKINDIERVSNDINVKLNLTEDTQSDTYKNIIGI